MALSAKNRKKVEKLITDTLNKLDPSGINAKKYQDKFKSMNDKEFLAFFKKIEDDDTNHLYVENDLYGKNQITMDSIEDAADFLNLPLEEYVFIKHKSKDGEPIRSVERVPVMYVHLKRMQQLLSKKNISNVDITSGNVRSRITGGLNSTSKSGRFTDSDVQALISVTSETSVNVENINGDNFEIAPIMQELLHLRGDNNDLRTKLAQQISFAGDASIIEIAAMSQGDDGYKSTGQATHTLNIYYLGAGMKTDIVDRTYLTKGGSKK